MIPMLVLAALAAAAPLFARGSEDWFGLAPCELCLWQRWPYWVAAALAVLAAAWPGGRRWLGWGAVVAVLASGAVAAFHIGVEQHWWPSPLAACQALRATGPSSLDDMLRAMPMAPSKPCDAPAYLVDWAPLSLAQMNLVYALGLAAIGAMWVRRGEHA